MKLKVLLGHEIARGKSEHPNLHGTAVATVTFQAALVSAQSLNPLPRSGAHTQNALFLPPMFPLSCQSHL
jgi:hypothetical protein